MKSGRGFMDIGVGAFYLIEALVYMSRIDVRLPILVCVDRTPFPIRVSSLVSVYKSMASNRLRVLGCVA